MGTFTMDGTMYMPPTVPVLLQILSGVKKPEDLLPQGSVIGLPANSVIELSLPGGAIMSTGPHPFHLHGVSSIACIRKCMAYRSGHRLHSAS